MNKEAERDRQRTYSLNAAMNLWKGGMEAKSRNLKYHQMVDGIKYYFKEFEFHSMDNKKQLKILE